VTAVDSQSAERDLLRRIQEGNETAFREFVECYQSDVYRIARAITGHEDYADEVAQKVFAKAYFTLARFDGRGSLYAWLYRVSVNESCHSLRQHSVPTSPQRDFVSRLLERIPEEDHYLLFMRELEGLSIACVADATGLKETTIRARLFRTRQALAARVTYSNRFAKY
jgi:RNA polymerase sigma-70 factor (ECF subfamily)